MHSGASGPWPMLQLSVSVCQEVCCWENSRASEKRCCQDSQPASRYPHLPEARQAPILAETSALPATYRNSCSHSYESSLQTSPSRDCTSSHVSCIHHQQNCSSPPHSCFSLLETQGLEATGFVLTRPSSAPHRIRGTCILTSFAELCVDQCMPLPGLFTEQI